MNARALWDWLKEHFNTPDRRIGSVSLLLSLVGVTLSIFAVQFPGKPELIVLRDTVITFGLLALTIFFAIRYVQRGVINDRNVKQIQQSKSILSNQFKNSYHLVHNCKDEFFKQYYSPGTLHRLTAEEHRLVRHVCSQITSMTRKSLQEYFLASGIDIREDVVITVKLVVKPDEVIEALKYLKDFGKEQIRSKDRWVLTVYRDFHTYQQHRERETLGDAYEITTNTAFDRIFTHRAPYFKCNDLQALGDDKYTNQNSNWKKQYNATLVVPIGYNESPNSDNYVCYGFLAADSLNEDKHQELYNDGECFYILGHAADLLAILMLSLAIDVGNTTEVKNVLVAESS